MLWIVLKDRPQYSMLSDFHLMPALNHGWVSALIKLVESVEVMQMIVLDLSLKKV